MDSINTSPKNFFQNQQFALEIAEKGFVLAGNIGKHPLSELRRIHKAHHAAVENPSGIFHTIYSTDISYRKALHQDLQTVLKPIFDTLFDDYKTIGNYIIAKYSGTGSAFGIHQDTTVQDEKAFAPLNVWIPLQDTAIENGGLCLVPQSQKFAFPYRGASFAGQFDNLTEEIIPYLYPIKMKAGDLLIFDNRALHYSPPNTCQAPRVVVMSGIQHKDATILTCFKKNETAPIEIYQQNEDYLLSYQGFKKDPIVADSGTKVEELFIANPISDQADFYRLVNQYALEQHNAFMGPRKKQFYLNQHPFLSLLKTKWQRF